MTGGALQRAVRSTSGGQYHADVVCYVEHATAQGRAHPRALAISTRSAFSMAPLRLAPRAARCCLNSWTDIASKGRAAWGGKGGACVGDAGWKAWGRGTKRWLYTRRGTSLVSLCWRATSWKTLPHFLRALARCCTSAGGSPAWQSVYKKMAYVITPWSVHRDFWLLKGNKQACSQPLT